MKIRIAYKDHETAEKDRLKTYIATRYDNVKIHECAPKDGFAHTFLVIPNVKKPEMKRFIG